MIIFSIIGAIIGAGFASGQEIYLFFYRFGLYGILGLALCSGLISIIIYKTFLILYNKKIETYQEFLEEIFYKDKEKIKHKHLNISYILNIIINTFLLITFYIMISGFGAYFEQEFNINRIIGASILALIIFFILIRDVQGVTKVNSGVVTILIIIFSIIGFYNVKNNNNLVILTKFEFSWIIQAIIYCSYNMILVIPLLVELKIYIKNKRQIKSISIFTGIIIFILAINVFLLLTKFNVNFEELQMPAVYVISNNFPQFKVIYGIVILLAIFSTASSIGISFLKNITKESKRFPQLVGIMCITGIIISNIGFSNLVKILFPVFGYLGLIEIYYIIKKA